MSLPEIEPLHQHPRRRLQPYAWDELQSLPKLEPLVKGVLDRKALSVVYGESNCGKTFLTLDIALHVALGRNWRDKRVQQGNVLYIAAEGGLGLTERLQAFWLHHNLEDNLPPFHLIPCGVDLCSSDVDANEIVREAYILDDVQLIVIDTLARAMAGGNENSSEDMGAFIRNCDLIREKTGAHVMIVHHGGKDTAKGARGHSSLKAAVDTEIEVIKNEEGIVTAEIRKQRDGRTNEKFSSALTSVHLGQDSDGDPIYSCVLMETDAPASSKPRVAGRQKRAMDTLHNLIGERGIKGVPKNGMSELTFVRIDDFRAALKAANIIASDNPDSVRRGISSVIEALNNKGLTATWEEKIWPVG